MIKLIKKSKKLYKTKIGSIFKGSEMKKFIIISLIFASMIFTILAKTNINNISEISINTNKELSPIVNIKSTYIENFNLIKENKKSVYFDIKNAKLTDNYKTDYSADLSVVTQQIGSKIRVYLKGDNIDGTSVVFNSDKGINTTDYNALALLSGILALVYILAQKSYSATIKMKSKTTSNMPIQTAMNLNRQILETGRKKPEIALRKATNPIKNEVYDFKFAKNKKKTKIAI